MKTIDLTKPVMEQVVRLERKRTRRWIRVFSVTVAGLLIVAALLLVRAVLRLSERHTWDLFALLMEDKEIISEFWQDTAMIFFEELPTNLLLMAGTVAVAIALLFVFTAGKRTVVRRKMQELAKREKKQS